MTFVFCVLTVKCMLLQYSCTASKADYSSLSVSASTIVSSAYNNVNNFNWSLISVLYNWFKCTPLYCVDRLFLNSLINIAKRIGDKFSPCLTPILQ